jgi:hypothetical protein
MESIPDLTHISEAELLRMAAEIFVAPGAITPQQQKDLAAIDQEFMRRDSLLITTK